MKTAKYKALMNRDFNDPALEEHFAKKAKAAEKTSASKGMHFTSAGHYKTFMNARYRMFEAGWRRT